MAPPTSKLSAHPGGDDPATQTAIARRERALSVNAEALSRLLGVRVHFEAGAPETCATLPADGLAVGAVLEPASGALHGVAMLEVEPSFAHYLVDRALGGEGEDLGLGALTDAERGVLAFVLATTLEPTAALRIRSIFGDRIVGTAALEPEAGPFKMSPFIVRSEAGRLGWLRLWQRERDALNRSAGTLGTLCVNAPVRCGVVGLSLADWQSLEVDDIVTVDNPTLAYADGACVGHATSNFAEKVIVCVLREDGLEVERVDDGGAATLDDSKERVELSVELARVSLTADELNAVAPGATIQTDQSIGKFVQLCRGTRVIGTGELVDVDGELGVRILAAPLL